MVASQVGERIGVSTKWKFGKGNPMYGQPGIAFEVTYL